MNLRRTVFLAVALAVLATTMLEGVFDVIVDRFASERLFYDLIDIPLMLGLAAVIAWLVARRIARPLRSLTEATRRVAEQAFPTSLQIPPGNDELAELAASFNAMASAVQGYVERERAFTRYASHELRSPLSAIRLQIERAELGQVEPGEVIPALKRNVTQLEEILAALLMLARSPGKGSEDRLLSSLLHDSLALLPNDERQRVNIHDAGPPQLKISHSRLFQQALQNLLDNALRHGSGSASVALEASARSLTLRVNDDGPGLMPGELDRVTEPFYRAGGQEGAGLGLSFVAFIAKALEGELTLENSGGGLAATLTLPIVATAT